MQHALRRRRLVRVAGVFLCGALGLAAATLGLGGCGDAGPVVFAPVAPTGAFVEPAHVVVQHLLIGFQGSVPGREITRTRAEARQLAEALLRQALEGADFDALVRAHTDDAWPGIYGMSNRGVPPNPAANPKEYPRSGMVPAFGDVGFRLQVGEYGLAPWDAKVSPYGWHLIKRLR